MLKDILKKSPQDPHAHAARFLRDPYTADKVANFARSEDHIDRDLLDLDARIYSTMAVALDGHNAEPNDEQTKRARNLYEDILTNELPPDNL